MEVELNGIIATLCSRTRASYSSLTAPTFHRKRMKLEQINFHWNLTSISAETAGTILVYNTKPKVQEQPIKVLHVTFPSNYQNIP